MKKEFYSIWDSKYGSGFNRNINSLGNVAFIIANGGILSQKQVTKLTKNTEKIEKFGVLEDNGINYFEYFHKADCQSLQIAGEDLCNFINYVQTNFHYETIIIVAFSKATIAGYYALISKQLKHICQLKFIVGGAPWKGTELCDSQELKKIPCRIPWTVVKVFIKVFLKTDLEKDLSPNSESIKNIDFKKLNSIVDVQYDTNKEKYRSNKLKDIFPDSFVCWVFKGHFADGVIPMQSQKATDVKHILLTTTHCSALQKMVDDIYIHLN